MARWRLALVPAAGVVALALAACGGRGGPIASAQSGSGPGPGTVTFAKCMRARGVSQFPDPGGPRPAGSEISVMGAHLPPTIDINAPAFRAAMTTCMKPLLAGHPRPPVSAAQKAAALRFTQCMRAHGVPGFPDPKFPSDRGIAIAEPAGVAADAPAFQHAQKLCGNP